MVQGEATAGLQASDSEVQLSFPVASWFGIVGLYNSILSASSTVAMNNFPYL